MKQRDPILVLLLSFITCGIYAWYWLVVTKNELNDKNKEQPHVPTAWIWLIPFVGKIWWEWKYSEGVDKRTNGKCSQVIAFVLMFLLSFIGYAIIQDFFNKVGSKS